MSLRFQNERIITSLRASYLSHRHEDSLLLGDGLDTGNPVPLVAKNEEVQPLTEPPTTDSHQPLMANSVNNLDPNPLQDLSFESDSSFDNELIEPKAPPIEPQTSPVKPQFFNRKELPKQQLGSQLTAQLQTATQDPKEQYLEAVAGLNPDNLGYEVTIHFSTLKSITIRVKQDCSAHLALGYALYKAGMEPGDANYYNLHLAEDDGSIDEDFPALDRLRPIAGYHADELAISVASEQEFKENQKRTPNKLPFNRPGLHHRESSRMTLKSVRRTSTNQDSMVVQMYMSPYDELLSQPFWTSPNLNPKTLLYDVFEQMCWEKMMDLDMYVLRSIGSKDFNANLQYTLQDFVRKPKELTLMFEIIALRSLKKPDPKPQKKPVNNRKDSAKPDALQNAVMAMQPLGFYKYPVLRRQQMNFLGRSERELIIDGEYIHLMPPADWSVIDQPKTTTFHIKQVLRVKQSRKTKTSLSIIVMKASGPKRYDLECENSRMTVEIVDRLKRLRQAIHKAMM